MVVVTTNSSETELEKLRSLATRTINEHRDDHGLCLICGSAWPCEFVVLADHNLALVNEP